MISAINLIPGDCQKIVHGPRITMYQCSRKAVVDGKWCRQHSPKAEAERHSASAARYDAHWKAEDEAYERRVFQSQLAALGCLDSFLRWCL